MDELERAKQTAETISNPIDFVFSNVLSGRERILTDIKPDSEENILKIFEKSLPIHERNKVQMERLLNIYLGKYDIYKRIIDTTGKSNNKVALNYAMSIVRDIVGYTYGEDIVFVHDDTSKADKVKELKKLYIEEEAFLEDQITSMYSSICGVGYQCVLASDDYQDNPEIGFKLGHLVPTNTFAVQSCELKNPVVMTCSYYVSPEDGTTKYTVYTNKNKYEIYNENGKNKIKDLGPHGCDSNPITMFENNNFLIGDFEPVIPLIDALNTISSESVNDLENFVQSLLVFINASLGDDEETRTETKKLIKENRMIELKAPAGMNVDAKYIAQQLNANNVTSARDYIEESMWKITGIPDRKTRSGGGGDTGDAVELRDGWADLEVVARNKERFFKKAKRQQLRNVLKIVSMVNDKLKDLESKDININFIRNKRDNLSTKTTAYATLIGTETLDPRDALDIANLTTNINEVIERGEKYYKDKEIGDETSNGENNQANEMSSMRENVDEN